jgi:hypothetical protein
MSLTDATPATTGEPPPGASARAGLARARQFAADDPASALASGVEALARAGRRPVDDFADFLFDLAHRAGDLTAAATVLESRCAGRIARMLAGTPHPGRPRGCAELLAQLGDVDEAVAAADEDAADEDAADAVLRDLYHREAAIVRRIAAQAGPAVAAAVSPAAPHWAELHRRIPPEGSVLYLSATEANESVTIRAAWLPAADLLARLRIQGATEFTRAAELRGSAHAWFRAVTSGATPYHLSMSDHPWQRVLAAELLPTALYEFLAEQAGPLEPHRLIVAPAGPLWSLPFAALTVGPRRSPLAEVTELSLIPALAMLRGRPATLAGREVLAFAGPGGDFDVAISALQQPPFRHLIRLQILDRPAQLAGALTNVHWDLAVIAADHAHVPFLGRTAPAALVLGSRLDHDASLPTAALLAGGRVVVCGVHPDEALLSKVCQGLFYKSGAAAVRAAQLEAIGRGEPPFSWAGLAVLAADDGRVLG